MSGGTTGIQRAPRITVGLPVYNGARFLDQAIWSIRRQTFADFELIIADNASTDESLDICRRHGASDDRIRILTSTHNRGAAWNFNRIVPEAAGEFFKWAAHDDVIAPDFLERCVAVLDADSDVVLSYPKAVDISASGEFIRPIRSIRYAQDANSVVRVREVLSFDTSCIESFGLVRIAALRSTRLIGPYTSSDRTLLLELAMRGKFHEIDLQLLERRQHETRSIRANARERYVWFDTSRAGVFTFPRWRLVTEYVRAGRHAPAPVLARAQMVTFAAVWGVRQWRQLGREIAAWVQYRGSALLWSVRRKPISGSGIAAHDGNLDR